MKKYFTTGLGLLLPVILTFLIVGFLINLLTKPFLSITETILIQSNLFTQPFLFLSETSLILITSKIIILLVIFFVVLIIGLIGRLFLIKYIFQFGDYLLHRVPVINKVYKATQDVVNSLFSSSSTSFSQVVFVPFPSTQNLSIGLVTKDALLVNTGYGDEEVVPVYIPGTPNPTVGFMLMFKKNQLIYSTMKADEAMKFVVSCGIVMPEFSTSPTPETTNEK